MSRQLKIEKVYLKGKEYQIHFYEGEKGHVFFVVFDMLNNPIDAGHSPSKKQAMEDIKNFVNSPNSEQIINKNRKSFKRRMPYDQNGYSGERYE